GGGGRGVDGRAAGRGGARPRAPGGREGRMTRAGRASRCGRRRYGAIAVVLFLAASHDAAAAGFALFEQSARGLGSAFAGEAAAAEDASTIYYNPPPLTLLP